MAEHGRTARSSPPTQDHRRAARGEVISDRQRTQNYANAIGGNARANTKAGLIHSRELVFATYATRGGLDPSLVVTVGTDTRFPFTVPSSDPLTHGAFVEQRRRKRPQLKAKAMAAKAR